LVVNAVLRSASEAAGRVGTRFPDQAAAGRLSDYAKKLESEDTLSSAIHGAHSVTSAAVNLAGTPVALLAVAISAVFGALASFAGAGGEAAASQAGRTTVIRLVGLALFGGWIAKIWNASVQTIGEAWTIADPAKSVLAGSVDTPERDLYALWHGAPPSRPALEASGPISAGVILAVIGLIAAAVGFFLAGFVLGTNTLSSL